MPQVGPMTMWVNSTTRRPLSGCGMVEAGALGSAFMASDSFIKVHIMPAPPAPDRTLAGPWTKDGRLFPASKQLIMWEHPSGSTVAPRPCRYKESQRCYPGRCAARSPASQAPVATFGAAAMGVHGAARYPVLGIDSPWGHWQCNQPYTPNSLRAGTGHQVTQNDRFRDPEAPTAVEPAQTVRAGESACDLGDRHRARSGAVQRADRAHVAARGRSLPGLHAEPADDRPVGRVPRQPHRP
ncbi:hypothetical protein Y695_03131 [Hydrogenophaga sp. T4]|nr:hypothetical protein Y695_03131 [Hydrogenophaga sp. T4]